MNWKGCMQKELAVVYCNILSKNYMKELRKTINISGYTCLWSKN
jgi:hypothetical protein